MDLLLTLVASVTLVKVIVHVCTHFVVVKSNYYHLKEKKWLNAQMSVVNHLYCLIMYADTIQTNLVCKCSRNVSRYVTEDM